MTRLAAAVIAGDGRHNQLMALIVVSVTHSYRAKAQRLRSMAETMTIAQVINWFQAVEIKIRLAAFVLPLTTPRKSRNMSRIFCRDIFL